MTVNPGYSGQSFHSRDAAEDWGVGGDAADVRHPVRILLDGGVEPENIRELYELGTNDFVSGGGLFYHRPLAARLKEFREAMA